MTIDGLHHSFSSLRPDVASRCRDEHVSDPGTHVFPGTRLYILQVGLWIHPGAIRLPHKFDQDLVTSYFHAPSATVPVLLCPGLGSFSRRSDTTDPVARTAFIGRSAGVRPKRFVRQPLLHRRDGTQRLALQFPASRQPRLPLSLRAEGIRAEIRPGVPFLRAASFLPVPQFRERQGIFAVSPVKQP
jgi:hypothetical protein